jgi:hypothetical protein
MKEAGMQDVKEKPAELDLETLLVVNDGDTLEDLRLRVATALGVDEMPLAAVRRMMVDEEFFHHLIATRSAPAMLRHLLHSPANRAWERPDPEPETPATADGPGAGRLMAKAATAFLGWAKGGFTRVEKTVYERRLAACNGCDRLAKAPDELLYRIMSGLASDNRSCSACGCVVATKAWLPRENCPLPDPATSGLSRWGEPIGRRR